MTTARNQRIAPFPTMKNIKAKSFYVLKSFWVSILAVAIGTCLLSASLVFGDSIKSGMQTGARQLVGNADLVFEGTPKNHWRVDRGVLADIQSLDTNVSIQEFKQEAIRSAAQGTDGTIILESHPNENNFQLSSGRSPNKPGEVLISQSLAEQYNLAPGSNWKVTDSQYQGASNVHITGVVSKDSPEIADARTPTMYTTVDDAVEISGVQGVDYIFVSSQNGKGLQNSVQSLQQVQNGSLKLIEPEQAVKEITQQTSSGVGLISKVMAIFGLIGVVVSSLLIANIFQTYGLRRQKEFALLRSLGASKRQVSLRVIREGLFVGLLGSLIGLGAGVMIVKLYTGITDSLLGARIQFSFSFISALTVAIVGVLSSIIASLKPALSANKVSPALMVGGIGEASATLPPSRKKLFSAIFFLFLGISLTIFGATSGIVLLTIIGAIVLVIGLILALQPALYLLGGKLCSWLSSSPRVSYQIGMENIRRNSGRAASSALALTIGTGLAAMTSVGLATGIDSTLDYVNHQAPIDATLSGRTDPSTIKEFQSISDISAAKSLPFATVNAVSNGKNSEQLVVAGLTQEAPNALRDKDVIPSLGDGEILLGKIYGYADGETITLQKGNHQIPVTVKISEAGFSDPLITKSTFDQLRAPQEGDKIWIRFSSSTPDKQQQDAVSNLASRYGLEIEGSIGGRTNALNLLYSYAAIMLSIAGFIVLVSLLGMLISTNMSIIERRDEIKLFRSLGSDRRGVLKTFSSEALVVSTVGSTTGVLLGTLIGLTGAQALLRGEDLTPTVSIPWVWIVLILLVCTILGTLSSFIASAKSAKGSPAGN
ncbi:hypothetical protein HMPREF3155_03965 [Corynebacterium sp. HMSC06D04]|uniref:FtsX-like permease family protein n=2 Tax=Corynebacteriaceae TaxID=1653 RepID=UPI0008A590C3|nr:MULTISPECIES: FtsX-like permease family protein [Corynebacterium]MDK8877592.1 FtsX-like permease family protein [Corynebacterium striatum]OFT52176.1 hypothetical protein HMPREF3155_03965 [Corynebacterium sp. HMSC06D04]